MIRLARRETEKAKRTIPAGEPAVSAEGVARKREIVANGRAQRLETSRERLARGRTEGERGRWRGEQLAAAGTRKSPKKQRREARLPLEFFRLSDARPDDGVVIRERHGDAACAARPRRKPPSGEKEKGGAGIFEFTKFAEESSERFVQVKSWSVS